MVFPQVLVLTLLAGSVSADEGPAFEEVAKSVELDYQHQNGMTGKLYAAEHMGPAVALFDYDNDGDLDVYLGQGGTIAGNASDKSAISDRLFRNDLEPGGDRDTLHFTDVTKEAGLSATGYNMGVATGDYDRDGWVDLYVTNLGSNHLLWNDGKGSFVDKTAEAGADDSRFSVPASFFDFDGDGFLDLFIGNYNDFRPSQHKACYMPQGSLDYCGPLAYAAEPDRLLRNRGDGTFEDVTARAGMADVDATALGSVTADLNGDGLLDLYVANDLMANHLWLNQGNGRFVDEALLSGTALDGNGKPQASMGVVAGDLNGDGFPDLFMSHLVRETNTLYLNDGRGMFVDASQKSGLGAPSFGSTGFGTVVLDYDGDGVLDIYVANGAVHHIAEQLEAGEPHPLRQPNQLFRGMGSGSFLEVPESEREAPVRLEVSRAVAVGDIDNDGDPDLVLTNNAGPARLLLNRRQRGRSWLGVRLVDEVGIDVYGAEAEILPAPEGASVRLRAHTDGSYAAASDPRLLFANVGEGPANVGVRWPGGLVEEFGNLDVGEHHTLTKGRGTSRGAEQSPP